MGELSKKIKDDIDDLIEGLVEAFVIESECYIHHLIKMNPGIIGQTFEFKSKFSREGLPPNVFEILGFATSIYNGRFEVRVACRKVGEKEFRTGKVFHFSFGGIHSKCGIKIERECELLVNMSGVCGYFTSSMTTAIEKHTEKIYTPIIEEPHE